MLCVFVDWVQPTWDEVINFIMYISRSFLDHMSNYKIFKEDCTTYN